MTEAATEIKIPEPGLYYDVPFADYLAWPLVNSSAIKWGQVSMRHMHAAVWGLLDDTDSSARKFGRALHCFLLDGEEKFNETFLISKKCMQPIMSGKRKGDPCGNDSRYFDGNDWFCGQHRPPEAAEPSDYITAAQRDSIATTGKRMHEHPALQILARPGGFSEVSFVCELDGVLVKGRLDKHAPRVGNQVQNIIDLKKCQVGAISDHDCEQTIKRYGYHVQAALYSMCIGKLTKEYSDFIWVFAEDGKPHDVNVMPIDNATLAVGEYEVGEVLGSWRRCLEKDNYPGVAEALLTGTGKIRRGGLPEKYRTWRQSEINV